MAELPGFGTFDSALSAARNTAPVQKPDAGVIVTSTVARVQLTANLWFTPENGFHEQPF
jgi:hypothetical protein